MKHSSSRYDLADKGPYCVAVIYNWFVSVCCENCSSIHFWHQYLRCDLSVKNSSNFDHVKRSTK